MKARTKIRREESILSERIGDFSGRNYKSYQNGLQILVAFLLSKITSLYSNKILLSFKEAVPVVGQEDLVPSCLSSSCWPGLFKIHAEMILAGLFLFIHSIQAGPLCYKSLASPPLFLGQQNLSCNWFNKY